MKFVTNLFYHRRKCHPDKPAKDFNYDTKAKRMGVGPYVNFKGYFCPKCETTIKDLDTNFTNKHKDIDQTTEYYKRIKDASKVGSSEWRTVVNKFESELVTDGGGTGMPSSKADARKYCNQILKLVPDEETFLDFQVVFKIIKLLWTNRKMYNVSTQHAYVVTLLRFLKSLRIHCYTFINGKYLKQFIERVEQWQKGLRKKRKKREEEFKLKESSRLEDAVQPFTAILKYEKSNYHKQICSYRNDDATSSDVKQLRLVYSDIFNPLIYRQGIRGSTRRGMTVQELKNVDKIKKASLRFVLKIRRMFTWHMLLLTKMS